MSDSSTDFTRLLSPSPGDPFELDDGTVRVDDVTATEICFVRFHVGAQHGSPVRMPRDVWREAVRRYLTRDEEW